MFSMQPIADLRMGCGYKITHISAVTYRNQLKLRHLPTIHLSHMKLSYLHTHKYL